MCDYSLMMIDNRLAVEGEQLVAHRFSSGSTGLISLADFNEWRQRLRPGLWQRCKECFSTRNEPAPVVCIPPGAQLRLQDIPRALRNRFGLELCEDATFTQISANPNWHRDALIFPGRATTVMLQWLFEGQAVTVVRLSSSESRDPDPAIPEYVLAK
jgi:hypothetical protein